MKITLTKAGKNIRISFDPAETTQPDMLEDSANVEVTYQNLNNNVTVSISGGANFQTGNITTGTFLYMDSGSGPVLINSKALFLTNYPLVFPSGGGGPVTTPNIDQVLAQGGTLTTTKGISDGGNQFKISNATTGNATVFEMASTPPNIQVNQNCIEFNSSTVIFTDLATRTTDTLKVETGGTYEVQLGDYTNQSASTFLRINSPVNTIQAGFSGTDNGFMCDFTTRKFSFGDYAGIFNGSKLEIDDNNSVIKLINNQSSGYTEIACNILRFQGANLESASAGGNSGQHLVIELNGVQYKIRLENP